MEATAYTIPTDAPESDGTFAWDSTTMVLVTARAGGKTGTGYTYAGTTSARACAITTTTHAPHVFAEHRVGGVGGDTLGGVYGDGVAVGEALST